MQGNVINEIELNNHLEKINCLIRMQKENFKDINNSIDKLSSYYQTSNTNKLLELNRMQENNYMILKESLNKYTNVIKNTVSKYHRLVKETEQIFDNIL